MTTNADKPSRRAFLTQGGRPAGWPRYEVTFRPRSATYRVRVENPADAGRGGRSVTVDQQLVPGGAVPVRDDGRAHEVRVVLG